MNEWFFVLDLLIESIDPVHKAHLNVSPTKSDTSSLIKVHMFEFFTQSYLMTLDLDLWYIYGAFASF